ncbi:MAG: hypothetical protein HY895_00265 [Deltaproteobacteria bacterium]|nr:hypothetical protein [Deltaproteobacteria bacterium]
MSSILNALKKIEESAPPEESLNPAKVSNPRTVFGQRHSGRRLTSKIIYMGLAAVVVLAAGILIKGWMSGVADPRSGKPVTAAADSAPVGADAFRAKLPAGKTAAPSPPVAAPPPSGQAESAAAPAPIPRAAPEASAAQRPAPPAQAARPAARALPKETPRAPSAERPSALAERSAPARETTAPNRPPAARTPEDNLSRLDDAKLKVMAIAWHGQATRRLAVINGHIVKEGEAVDGYTVTQIRKDDVIVNDGSRSWRVEFALKVQP